MPIYEYRCPDCGNQFERLQKMSDPAVTDCPSCDGAQVQKLISQTAFVLKGGGWYKDHYGLKSGEGKSGDASSSASSGGKTSSDAPKTESKPADTKKAEAKPAASKPAASTTAA